MRRPRLSCVAVLLVVALSLSMTSCGGGGGGAGASDLVLLGFNLPNLSGIPLNNPLIFTFSANINPLSITPDTLRVVGAVGPFFETTVVDGNLVALLPDIPNFDDYTDAGLAPDTQYTVSFSVFPAPSTIETPDGKPLLLADTFTFVTQPSPVFIEHRRPIRHGVPPSLGGRSDDEGCLQNSDNALFVPPGVVQTGSGPGATALCLMNEGAPRIIEAECSPRHDERDVGTPSAVFPGRVELPPIIFAGNEAFDPLTVTPYVPTTQLPVNMQLLRVAQKDETPITPPEEVQTNQPLIVQTLESVQIILVASGAVQQGIYCVNVTPNVRDLAQNQLRIDDDPDAIATGYGAFDANVALPGWRLYFRTVDLPATALALNETYSNNNREWGDLNSGTSEPGLMTWTSAPDPGGLGLDDPLLTPLPGATATPNLTLPYTQAGCGQSTSANWNNGSGTGYRLLNIATLDVNPDVSAGADELRAVWKPWTGTAEDPNIDTTLPGVTEISLNTTSGSVDNDGIFEVDEINIEAGDLLTASGNKPLIIFCRGDCTINGTIDVSGAAGGIGLDTDGTANYSNAGTLPAGGAPGAAGPGGGNGGAGNNPVLVQNGGVGFQGGLPSTVHADNTALFAGVSQPGVGPFDTDPAGGAGGSLGSPGTEGQNAGITVQTLAGTAFNNSVFEKPIAEFQPDRGYLPFSNVCGGMGGSGGTADDSNANTTVENGDAGGGGGGGGGGGVWIIAHGTVSIGASAVIRADGGDGGHVYAVGDQVVDDGPDEMPASGDEIITGIDPMAMPSGSGGPGGGGSGGSICIIGRTSVTVANGATLSAVGGSGGQSGSANLFGGDGGDGLITLATFGSSASGPTVNSSNIDPTAFTATRFNPPHDGTTSHASVGQTTWIDLSTPTTTFNPGGTNLPSVSDNFVFLTSAPFNLVQGPASDFDVTLEFQGADDLFPALGGPGAPTLAQGLTDWETDITLINGKRFIRWRFRFHVGDTYPGWGISGAPMPSILEITIPYTN